MPCVLAQRTIKSGVLEFANACKCSKINSSSRCGRVAQLGEHLLCKQGVTGSIPVTSTTFFLIAKDLKKRLGPNAPFFVHWSEPLE